MPVFRQEIVIFQTVEVKKLPHSTATQDFFYKDRREKVANPDIYRRGAFFGEKGVCLSSYLFSFIKT